MGAAVGAAAGYPTIGGISQALKAPRTEEEDGAGVVAERLDESDFHGACVCGVGM